MNKLVVIGREGKLLDNNELSTQNSEYNIKKQNTNNLANCLDIDNIDLDNLEKVNEEVIENKIIKKNIQKKVTYKDKYGNIIETIEEVSKSISKVNTDSNNKASNIDENFKNSKKSRADCLEAVKRNGLLLEYVDSQNYLIVLKAVENNGMALQFAKYIDESICLAAVKQNGLAIQFIDNPSYTMKKIAIQSNPFCIEFIKELEDELAILALRLNPKIFPFIKNISEQIAIDIVRYDTETIKDTRVQSHNKACLLAVKKDGLLLRYIQDKNKTEEICEEAVKNNELAIKYTNKSNEIMWEHVVGINPWLITDKSIDKTGTSYKVYLKGNAIDGLLLAYTPKEYQTDELIEIAIENNGMALEFVPNQNELLVKKAIENNPLALKYASREYKTKEICNIALTSNVFALPYITDISDSILNQLDFSRYIFSYIESTEGYIEAINSEKIILDIRIIMDNLYSRLNTKLDFFIENPNSFIDKFSKEILEDLINSHNTKLWTLKVQS